MRRLLALLLLAASPAPAFAACVTSDTLERGVLFTRADGRSGLAKRTVGSILIDYDIGKTEWDDRREAEFGIYETDVTRFLSDEMLVGSGSTVYTRTFRGEGPEPETGESWSTTIRGEWISYDSTEKGYSKGRISSRATYRFLEEREVKLSGCTYRMIPVEATFDGKGQSSTQRWAYFPDLYFGLETMSNGEKRGLTMMKPL